MSWAALFLICLFVFPVLFAYLSLPIVSLVFIVKIYKALKKSDK